MKLSKIQRTIIGTPDQIVVVVVELEVKRVNTQRKDLKVTYKLKTL